MTTKIDIEVPANEDEDDCLTAAASEYIEQHPDLANWDLDPRWTDDSVRETVTLTVPAWAVDLPADRHALAEQLKSALPTATVVARSGACLGTRSQAVDAGDPDVSITLGELEVALWWDETCDSPGWVAEAGGADNEPVDTFADVLALIL